ncbi:MAG: DNA primase [Acidimicrobiia bacterium]|nr:DNA primase [Acidimicrobiia bacterium]
MGIVDEDIATLRERADIVSVIGEHVQLRRVGRRWQGLCPFHAEKSPSFSVNREDGLYYCFGCGAKGDVITFIREIEHLDFVGAVEKLAATAGMTLRYTDVAESEGRRRRSKLHDAVERAVDFYHRRLLNGADAGPARAYLRSRGVTGDEVRTYKLGWAPQSWDALAKALRLPDDVFVEAGLGRLNNWGGQTDAFRGRIMFPIFDAGGKPVGFGGRAMPGEDPRKYINSPDGVLYHKSRVLYGLHWAKGDIVAADEAIVCEGYTDVIGFAAVGMNRAVATCGTALTEDHVRTLRSFARRVVLAFDADAAGQHAAERIYAWERQFELDVAVARLPAGSDPGDLARSDPEALRRAVNDALPFLGFRVQRVLDAGRLDTPEGRAQTAEAAMVVISEHPSELVRDEYLMTVASRTRLDPDRLRSMSRGRRSGGGRGGPAATDARGAVGGRRLERASVPGPEREALRLLVADFASLAPALHPCLFSDERARAVYEVLQRHDGSVRAALDDLAPPPGQGDDPPASLEAGPPAGVDDPVADLLRQVATEQSGAETDDVVARLVEAAAQRAIDALRYGASHADDPLVYAADLVDLKRWSEELRDPDAGSAALSSLLVWLADRFEETA